MCYNNVGDNVKKCSDCNIEMLDNCILEGQHPFEIGVDGRTDISLHIPTGEKGSLFGIPFDKKAKAKIKARLCPNCGKVEFYIDMTTLTK